MRTWRDIPGWCGDDVARLYRRQVEQAHCGARFVEIGTWVGRSTCLMGELIRDSGKPIIFHAVDHFAGSPELKDQLQRIQSAGSSVYLELLANLTDCGVRDVVRVHAADSVDYSQSFPDHTLDFVFIDGDHSTERVHTELAAWLPKIRPGGTVAGHDWTLPSVRAAVLPFFTPLTDNMVWWYPCTPTAS